MKILNIQAHPDDAECNCGGTIAKYASRGYSVYYLICTKGNRGTYDRALDMNALAEIRRSETRRAAEILGVRDVYFLDEEDGFLYPGFELRGKIMKVIRKLKPDTVMTLDPFMPYEVHPDHRTVGMLASEAVVFAGFPLFYPEHLNEGIEPHFVKELYFYKTTEPNYYEDIAEYLPKKLEACYAHISQIEMAGTQVKAVTNDSRSIEELGREVFRDIAVKLSEEAGRQTGIKYAESFRRFRVKAGHIEIWQ